MARRREFDEEELGRLNAAMHRPRIELASRVGRFQPPFEYLAAVPQPFGTDSRFILDRVLAGDAEAVRARDALITYHSDILVDDGDYSVIFEEERFLGDYFERHRDEVEAFAHKHAPWTAVHSSSVEALESDRDFDRKLDDAVFSTLGEFGFSSRTRNANKESWRCTSKILAAPITIEFDKGTFPSTVAHGLLIVNGPAIFGPAIGDPFFFSAQAFHYSRAHHVERQFASFFTEYARIFPHVLQSIEDGLAATNEVLATLR
jgi:hypothetical protein